jgi:hypothetical protein
MAFVWLAARCQPALAQQAVQASMLQIEVQNVVRYNEDLSDVTKFATNPSVTPSTLARNFYEIILIGDIVAVNGSPSRTQAQMLRQGKPARVDLRLPRPS